jgi:hypothetical protein
VVNKELLLRWILQDAERHAHYLKPEADSPAELIELLRQELYELNHRSRVSLPKAAPETAEKLLPILREQFRDQVTLVSRVLNHYFPQEYLFYRVSPLEEEIFAAFEFFAEVYPDFNFPFDRVGETGFYRYLVLNEALLQFCRLVWPELPVYQAHAAWLLYMGLGELFREKDHQRRYWLCVENSDPNGGQNGARQSEFELSGHKLMRAGDLIFRYRAAPHRAITTLLHVKHDPYFDPWSAWEGFWAVVEKTAELPPLTLEQLQQDPVIGRWEVVERCLHNVVTAPMPTAVYNQLLSYLPAAALAATDLRPETVGPEPDSGWYVSKDEFGRKVVEPLLHGWAFAFEARYRCQCPLGHQTYPGYIDYLVRDAAGLITLFETRLRLLTEAEQQAAVERARPYALLLGLPTFVVAAPEGLWIYAVQRGEAVLERRFTLDEATASPHVLRNLLLAQRP